MRSSSGDRWRAPGACHAAQQRQTHPGAAKKPHNAPTPRPAQPRMRAVRVSQEGRAPRPARGGESAGRSARLPPAPSRTRQGPPAAWPAARRAARARRARAPPLATSAAPRGRRRWPQPRKAPGRAFPAGYDTEGFQQFIKENALVEAASHRALSARARLQAGAPRRAQPARGVRGDRHAALQAAAAQRVLHPVRGHHPMSACAQLCLTAIRGMGHRSPFQHARTLKRRCSVLWPRALQRAARPCMQLALLTATHQTPRGATGPALVCKQEAKAGATEAQSRAASPRASGTRVIARLRAGSSARPGAGTPHASPRRRPGGRVPRRRRPPPAPPSPCTVRVRPPARL